jgi:mycothiol synthase
MNVRPVTESDLESVLRLMTEAEERVTGRPSRVGLADLRSWLSPLELARDTWLFEADGTPAAAGWCEAHGEIGVAFGNVHPDAKGRGFGAQLVTRAEGRLRELDVPRVHQVCLAADRQAARLFSATGYREVRRFYMMAIVLEDVPPEPVLPSGLTIDVMQVGEERAFHQALDDAFQDHWEHHTMPFEQWWQERSSAPDYDRTLWFVVRDGGELAAAVRNVANRNGGGLVAALGVRRPWRQRGLGRALLLHTFGEFYRRGIELVSLGVDAENPTGATKLYESVGMITELERLVYERALT